MTAEPILVVDDLVKTFTLHQRGGVTLEVLDRISLRLAPGECLALDGPSGAGKSTLLRTVYGNYGADAGGIRVRHDGQWVDLAQADPRVVMAVRRTTLGYVGQFLRVIPRVTTLDVVAAPLVEQGVTAGAARDQAAGLLEALDLPARLWTLPPQTFSGGEQQRVNIARGLIGRHPVLLMDEPTASLDADNRDRVIALVRAALDRGVAILGIFHDPATRAALATRLLPVVPLGEVRAA